MTIHIDKHAYPKGAFGEGWLLYLGSTSNEKNVYIKDNTTNKIKIGTHVYFDEAHMSTPASKAPIVAQALQRLGYNQTESWVQQHEALSTIHNTVQVQILSKNAKVPKRGTKGAIGYDVHHPGKDVTLKSGETKVFPFDIALTPPDGCYTRVSPRSGLTIKK